MQTDLLSLTVNIIGNSTSLRRSLNNTVNDVTRFSRQMTSSLNGVENQMDSFVNSTAAMSAGVAMSLGVMTNAFAQFDDRMRKATSMLGKSLTEPLRREMSNLAIDVSTKTRNSANEVADIYYYLISAGFDAQQSMKALAKVENFVMVSGMSTSKATEVLADAMFSLGMNTKDATANMNAMVRITDVVTYGASKADTTVQQLAEALTARAGPAMRTYGISLEEGTAMLMGFANAGIKGKQASTWFSIFLRDVTQAFNKNKEKWAAAGIELFDKGELRRTYDVVKDLSKLLMGLNESQRKGVMKNLGFNTRSEQATIAIMNESAFIQKSFEEINANSKDFVETMKGKWMEAFTSQFTTMTNSIKALFLTFGVSGGFDSLAKTFTKIADTAKGLIDSFKGDGMGFAFAGLTAQLAGFTLGMNLAVFLLGKFKTLLSILSFGKFFSQTESMVSTLGEAQKASAPMGAMGSIAPLTPAQKVMQDALKSTAPSLPNPMAETFSSKGKEIPSSSVLLERVQTNNSIVNESRLVDLKKPRGMSKQEWTRISTVGNKRRLNRDALYREVARKFLDNTITTGRKEAIEGISAGSFKNSPINIPSMGHMTRPIKKDSAPIKSLSTDIKKPLVDTYAPFTPPTYTELKDRLRSTTSEETFTGPPQPMSALAPAKRTFKNVGGEKIPFPKIEAPVGMFDDVTKAFKTAGASIASAASPLTMAFRSATLSVRTFATKMASAAVAATGAVTKFLGNLIAPLAIGMAINELILKPLGLGLEDLVQKLFEMLPGNASEGEAKARTDKINSSTVMFNDILSSLNTTGDKELLSKFTKGWMEIRQDQFWTAKGFETAQQDYLSNFAKNEMGDMTKANELVDKSRLYKVIAEQDKRAGNTSSKPFNELDTTYSMAMENALKKRSNIEALGDGNELVRDIKTFGDQLLNLQEPLKKVNALSDVKNNMIGTQLTGEKGRTYALSASNLKVFEEAKLAAMKVDPSLEMDFANNPTPYTRMSGGDAYFNAAQFEEFQTQVSAMKEALIKADGEAKKFFLDLTPEAEKAQKSLIKLNSSIGKNEDSFDSLTMTSEEFAALRYNTLHKELIQTNAEILNIRRTYATLGESTTSGALVMLKEQAAKLVAELQPIEAAAIKAIKAIELEQTTLNNVLSDAGKTSTQKMLDKITSAMELYETSRQTFDKDPSKFNEQAMKNKKLELDKTMIPIQAGYKSTFTKNLNYATGIMESKVDKQIRAMSPETNDPRSNIARLDAIYKKHSSNIQQVDPAFRKEQAALAQERADAAKAKYNETANAKFKLISEKEQTNADRWRASPFGREQAAAVSSMAEIDDVKASISDNISKLMAQTAASYKAAMVYESNKSMTMFGSEGATKAMFGGREPSKDIAKNTAETAKYVKQYASDFRKDRNIIMVIPN